MKNQLNSGINQVYIGHQQFVRELLPTDWHIFWCFAFDLFVIFCHICSLNDLSKPALYVDYGYDKFYVTLNTNWVVQWNLGRPYTRSTHHSRYAWVAMRLICHISFWAIYFCMPLVLCHKIKYDIVQLRQLIHFSWFHPFVHYIHQDYLTHIYNIYQFACCGILYCTAYQAKNSVFHNLVVITLYVCITYTVTIKHNLKKYIYI